MRPNPIVYIADLRHTAGGVISNSYMPVGIGYMKSVMGIELPEVECTTFAYPDELLEALKLNPPDVLMLTNYMWNERLSQHFTKVMKDLRSETLVVAGGPNMSLDKERQIEYFKSWDGLDVYALGEGDFLATEIVNRFLDAGKSIPKLAKNGIPSSIFSLDGQVIHQEVQKKGNELAKIPSPWLNGAQDHFFDGKLVPMIETNRGCPFKCTFCVQGSDYYDRVAQFPADQVVEELTYIARRIKKVCPNMGALGIADANFAMFKRDLAISTHIGQLQKDYGWPGFVACSTGKNAPELIVKSIEQANGALEMLHAVQSMDENVLQSIKRSNIKLDTYNKVTSHLTKKGLRTSSQVILGLPQETLKGHLDGLRELIDKGIDSMQNLQLVLLKGTDMESEDDREKYGFETKFRLTIRGFGNYGESSRVFDVEETVTSTNTLSSEDYLKARVFHLGSGVYWNQDWFNDLFYYARGFGVKFSECLDEIIKEMHADKGVLGNFIQDFVDETKAELFATPEECIKFYSEEVNFEKLHRGEIGDNLMNKYRAIASFLIWPQVCQLAAKAVKKLIIRTQQVLPPEVDQFFGDLCKFIEAKHAAGDNENKLFSPVSCKLQYDIPKWVLDGHAECVEKYRLEEPSNYIFKLSEMRSRELKKAVNTFSMDLWGLTKLVRNAKVTCQEREGKKINAPEEERSSISGALV